MKSETPFNLKLPVYAMLLKDATGVSYLTCASDVLLPLFTSVASLQAFIDRSGFGERLPLELPTIPKLAAFLRNQPIEEGQAEATLVVIDPFDKQPPLTAPLFNIARILEALPK